MSYIEKRALATETKWYFVKKFALLSKQFTIKKYIGSGNIAITKEKYLLDNIESLSKEEFTLRQPLLPTDVAYTKSLLEKNELYAIKIANFLEGKNCYEEFYIEFAKKFIFNSNNIEGTKMPEEKVREVIEKGDTKYAERNEVKEVKNSINAFDYLQTDFKFNLSSIKKLYHILTKDLYRDGNQPYPKGFKKESNVVANEKTSDPKDVELHLTQLLDWYKSNKKNIHPITLAFEFHKKYEKIHPFVDGNGRTGRLIMNKILLSSGYPPIIVFTENKTAYFNAFEKAHATKKYSHFMLEQSIKSYEFAIRVLHRY